MALIKKRADELRIGDITKLSRYPGDATRREICVLDVYPAPAGVRIICGTAGNVACAPAVPPSDRVWVSEIGGAHEVDVEVPDLTPAQQHAEELALMLRKALAWCREQVGPVPAWVAEARELLDQVRPEPPTLAEVLSQLQAVHDAKHPGDELIRVQLLLERARRAGLL